MPPATFCLVMSMLILTAAWNTIDTYKRSYATRSAESENLRIILNYIRSKQKYPTIFSLVSSDARSKFTDFLSKYVASESIVSYKITMNDFSQKCTWQNHVDDHTWIFIVDNIDILNSLVYEQSHIWKATNQYLVIITAPNVMISPRETFQMIWRSYSVYRIVIISIRDDFRCFSKYLPFDKNQRDEYGVVRKICLMDQESNVELYDNFKNLNGYPIKVIAFQSLMMDVTFDEITRRYRFDKLDAQAMSLLEKTLGAQFRIDVLTNFTHNINDPFHISLRYIENGESDMIITGFFIQKYEFGRYEFTTSVYDDKLCLIAPTTGFVPKSYMPIMPFALDLWVALAVYNVLMSILWFLVKYYSESFFRRKTIHLPLMRTPILAQRSDRLPPRIHPYVSSCFHLVETSCYPLQEDSGTTAQRVLLFGTLFFGLIITNLYQSILVSTLSDPPHYPELNTLEDVANSNFTIITKYSNLNENTFKGNTTLDNKLQSKSKTIVSKRKTNDMVAFGPEKVIAITRYASFMLDDMTSYYDADGNDLLHVIDECPTSYLLSYVMKLYSPYRERIDWLLLRMQEAGLVKMWYDNMVYPMYVVEQKRKMDKSERRIKLTMEHYSLTFAGLSIGLLSCSVVFLAELYFAKRSQSRH